MASPRRQVGVSPVKRVTSNPSTHAAWRRGSTSITAPGAGGRSKSPATRGSHGGTARESVSKRNDGRNGKAAQEKTQSGWTSASQLREEELVAFLDGILDVFRETAAAEVTCQDNTSAGGMQNSPNGESFRSHGAAKLSASSRDENLRRSPTFDPTGESCVDVCSDDEREGLTSPCAGNRAVTPISGSCVGHVGSVSGVDVLSAPPPLTCSTDVVQEDSINDHLTALLRKHALRTFLEETCGTVVQAFDMMVAIAQRASSPGLLRGSDVDRSKYRFNELEFCTILDQMGYGEGAATTCWWQWSALFTGLDTDGDGTVSLQDMYSALVLDLPPAVSSSRQEHAGAGEGAFREHGAAPPPSMHPGTEGVRDNRYVAAAATLAALRPNSVPTPTVENCFWHYS